jgi:hypothetical protein
VTDTLVRVGCQRPRLLSVPARQVTSSGRDAADFAASCGLILDDWQQWCLSHILGEDESGRWTAANVCLIMPRQNGKNSVLEALELYAFYVLDEKRILHTAHLAKTAADHMQRMVALVRANPELDAITHVYFSNGKEALQRTDTGARLEFITRGRKTARGGSPSRLVFDEALFLTDEQMQAILPAMSAQSLNADPPQFTYTSSAPLPESTVLHRVRNLGITKSAPGLFFAEWSCEPSVDINDRDAWYACNPALGIRISEQWIEEQELTQLSREAFLVERLGVVVSADVGSGVLPLDRWEACRRPSSVMTGVPRLALAVGPGMAAAAFAVAGVATTGVQHIEVTDAKPGTGWVVEIAARATKALGCGLIVDPRSPSAGLFGPLRAAGVELIEVSTGEYVGSCAGLQDAVLNQRVAHIGQPVLDAAVVGADIRPVGESWAWSQRASTIDITPLVAVTLAHGVAPVVVPEFFVY